MKPSPSKIEILNALLARGSPWEREIFANATSGIMRAVCDARGMQARTRLADFAKNILPLYCPEAEIEVLDFTGGFFDPLFAVSRISAAVRRIAGSPRPILVIAALERQGIPENGRMSKKRANQYAENIDFIEAYIDRYKTALPNLEIFFV